MGSYGKLDNRYFLNKLRKIASYIEGPVIDVGGYTGELSRFTTDKYFLLDNDPDAIKEAKKKKIPCVEWDLNYRFLPNKKYENVVLSDVMDLVFDAERLLKNAVDVAERAVIISVTNDNTIFHRIKVLFGMGINSSPFSLHYHLRHPTFKQWEKLIEKYLVIEETSYWICFRKEKPIWFDWILLALANLMPGLFARGAIYACNIRTK